MIEHYASDVIAAAMRLAQQQAMNSFTFRDLMHILNQHWRYCYQRITQIEPGFYSEVIRLTQQKTKLPRYIMGTLEVFRAPDPVGYNRRRYTQAGSLDLMGQHTYYLDGNDLWCRDVEFVDVWLVYTPQAPTVTFTMHNRNPRILEPGEAPSFKPRPHNKIRYGMYEITQRTDSSKWPPIRYFAQHMGDPTKVNFDITEALYRGPIDEIQWKQEMYEIASMFFDFPYAFVSYKHRSTQMYSSIILKDLLGGIKRHKYNPFDYTGRHSNVEFTEACYNDDTGMGVVVRDHEDEGKLKELGYTPDTKMTYPQDCVYDYLVAHIAKRFANRNETEIKDVDHALQFAEHEMSLFLKREKNPWMRVTNVTGRTIMDIL